jgi:hypothetical protein
MWTHLKLIESLKLEPTLDTSLHLGSSNHKLFSFGVGGLLNQLMLPPKWCHVDLALICPFLVLDPDLKAIGLIYGSHPIGLLYFIGPWTLGRHQKWPLLWMWMMMMMC